MERVVSNYDLKVLEKTLFALDEDHSSSALSTIKNELNRFFAKSKCKEVFYTINTDKLFFGMRVYPVFDGNKAIELLGDRQSQIFDGYYVEIDSKLLDPMLYLDGRELTAILIHEVGHIIYDTQTIDEVRAHLDVYFANSGESIDLKSSRGAKELLAYALKDAIMKAGSAFAKFGNEEIMADAFVASCGYGPDMESAMNKIVKSVSYLRGGIDNRFITLSWALRIITSFALFRIPALKTLNKAIQLTGSKLEQREMKYASRVISTMHDPLQEASAWDTIRERFSKKMSDWKRSGIRGIKNDVYELQLRLRASEDIDELMSIIRQCNSNISIIQDYMTEDIPDIEREDLINVLQTLYDIRETAAKNKEVKSRYSGYIQVTYPSI